MGRSLGFLKGEVRVTGVLPPADAARRREAWITSRADYKAQ